MTCRGFTFPAAVVVIALTAACGRSGDPPPASSSSAGIPQIRLGVGPSGAAVVDVVNVPPAALSLLERATLTRDEWSALFRVSVGGAPDTVTDRPAVLGTYSIAEGVLRFTPQFPFDAGQRYDVVVDPDRLSEPAEGPAAPAMPKVSATLELPAPPRSASTRVAAVYPSAPEVPENQLRMYILFSAPMGLQGGVEHVRLLDERGDAILDPFLPLDVDLWNEDRTRFTLLFDPGRVKRGILPNEQMGRSLVAGRQYTLTIDAAWRDAAGQPLAALFRREFRVGPPIERALDPRAWRLDAPAEGTTEPLVVSFPDPLDYALLRRALGVSDARGTRIAGEIALQDNETRWFFTPGTPWRAGEYHLRAAAILEDVAGNRIGKAFEVDAEASSRGAQARPAAIPFRIPPPAR